MASPPPDDQNHRRPQDVIVALLDRLKLAFPTKPAHPKSSVSPASRSSDDTSGGVPITDELIEQLADEAKGGYAVGELKRRGALRRPSSPPRAAVRTRLVRITVDLSPALHREIKGWVRDTAAALGRDVTQAEVMRVLARLMLDDKAIANSVREKL